jgi:hypothetical protein
MNRRIVFVAIPLLLAACMEKPQSIGTNAGRDAEPYKGTGAPVPFMAAGWKGGDQASWDSELKVRTQMGQNDYNKVQ